MKWSFIFCIFLIVLIDLMVFVKYLIQIQEMGQFKEDYPEVIAYEVILKTIICLFLLLTEGILVFRLRIFKACKAAYALKLIKIIFIFYQAFIKD